MASKFPLLEKLKLPAGIAKLSDSDLELLAAEVRQLIIDTVASNGGHLAPSLGVVELTMGLLSVFNVEKDKVIWDVGHQSYAWKILTDRYKKFHTLRQFGGISGFPKLKESPYDHFGVGHSSTSISAALGLAMARDLAGRDEHVIAVIGDGALTAGLAFEGLNLAGHMSPRKFIVILNDNEMSISPNVGALSSFLSRALSKNWVRRTKKDVLSFLRSIPKIGDDLATYALRGEWSFKSFFTPGMLFEAFKFNYIGPVDGHNLQSVIKHLTRSATADDRPVLLHVLTRKGKGYAPAEKNPSHFHGISEFEPATGLCKVKDEIVKLPSFTKVFANTLIELAESDSRIVAITAAMPEGTGTLAFQEKFPDRFVDVGICEQHAITFAAGLASSGLRPFVALYSTFLQRSYDQIIHDVCIQNLPVTFCIDRAGLVGQDGPTHHGVFDMAFLRNIPNMNIIAPRDENILRHALKTALDINKPIAIRYPRGSSFGVCMNEPKHNLEYGVGCVLQEGDNIAIIAVGNRVYPSLEAAQSVQVEINQKIMVFDPIWLKPLPVVQLIEIANKYKYILFVEEGVLAGGFSSSVLELWADNDLLGKQKIKRLGISDQFVEHGITKDLHIDVGIDVKGISKALLELIK